MGEDVDDRFEVEDDLDTGRRKFFAYNVPVLSES